MVEVHWCLSHTQGSTDPRTAVAGVSTPVLPSDDLPVGTLPMEVELRVKSARGMPMERRRLGAEYRYSEVTGKYELYSVGGKRVVDPNILDALLDLALEGEDALWDEHRGDLARRVQDIVRHFRPAGDEE